MIIGLCGTIGSGKDTMADYLVNNYDFCRASFAGALKDALAQVFGWDREMLEGRTLQSRNWREQTDQWWSKRLDISNLTPRKMLQIFGTDVCRQHLHDDIWVASLENRMRKSTDNMVITDCRFPNEIQAIRNAGGKIVRIIRGPDPDWYNSAVSVNRGERNNLNWAISKFRMSNTGVHQSEWAWMGTEFDVVVDNNGTLDHLYQQITCLVQDLQASSLLQRE